MPTVTCPLCGAESDRLATFPGDLCLDCWAKSDAGRRPVTAEELTAMWGGRL